MPSGASFGANERGEHPWIEQNTQQFCRVANGWPGDRQVTMVYVRKDVSGDPLISLSGNKVLKTRHHYGTGDNPHLHNRRDYLTFMQAMIEAGKRADFIENEVDIFSSVES